ncbi:MAG TPA: hypothetical protein VIW24_30250 [Aldersonia sp.]
MSDAALNDVLDRWDPQPPPVHRAGVFVTSQAVLRELAYVGVLVATDAARAAAALIVLDAGTAPGRTEAALAAEFAAAGRPALLVHDNPDGGGSGLVVSSRLARLARELPDERIRDASRIEDLAGVVRRACDEPSTDPLPALLAQTRDRITAAVPADTDTAALQRERARLLGARDGGRTEAVAALRAAVQQARVDLAHEVGTRVRAVNAAARADADGGQSGFLDRFGEAVHKAAAAVDRATERRLADLHRSLLGTAPAPAAPAPPPDLGAPPEPVRRRVEDRMTIVLGASAGLGLGRFAVAPLANLPALEVAAMPLTLLIGAFGAWWLARSRAQMADRARLRQWASDALANLKAQLEQRSVGRLLAVEADIADRLAVRAADRTVDIEDRLATVDAEMRRRTTERSACARDLEVLARHARELAGTGARGAASNPA